MIASNHLKRSAVRRGQRGMTLVELMVSIAIGLLITASMATLYANVSAGRGEIERTSRRMENGRYALTVLADEIQNAAYFAEFDPRSLAIPASTPDPCQTDATSVSNALRVYVQGYTNVAATVLSCLTDVKPGTDIIVIRRANGCTNGSSGCTPMTSGEIGIQASSCNNTSELGSGNVANYYKVSSSASDFTLTQKNCTTAADVRKLLVRIYYIAQNDKAGDGIPTLKRAELSGSSFNVVAIAQGVDNMRIEYGLDTGGTGVPSVYTPSPDLYLSCSNTTSPTCAGQWASVVTAKIYLLARNADSSAGFSDQKTYTLGHLSNGTNHASGSVFNTGPLGDNFKRTVFQSVVRFQNQAERAVSSSS